MKTCSNCRAIWPDEYNGQCADCGAGMAAVEANGGGNNAFAFARQTEAGRREINEERQMKSGNYDSVQVPQSVLDVAKGFIIDKRGRDA